MLFANSIKQDIILCFKNFSLLELSTFKLDDISLLLLAILKVSFLIKEKIYFFSFSVKDKIDVDNTFENKGKISGHILYQTLYSNDRHIQNTQEEYAFELEWPDGVIRNMICKCQAISTINKGNFYG